MARQFLTTLLNITNEIIRHIIIAYRKQYVRYGTLLICNSFGPSAVDEPEASFLNLVHDTKLFHVEGFSIHNNFVSELEYVLLDVPAATIHKQIDRHAGGWSHIESDQRNPAIEETVLWRWRDLHKHIQHGHPRVD